MCEGLVDGFKMRNNDKIIGMILSPRCPVANEI